MMNIKNIKKIHFFCVLLAATMIVYSIYLYNGISLEQLPMEYVRDIAVDIVGMMVAGIMLLSLYTDKNDPNRTMFRIIMILLSLFFLDVISGCIEGEANYVLAIKIVNTLGFVLEDFLVYAYWIYIKEEVQFRGKFLKLADIICILALTLTVLSDLLNWNLGFFFTISQTGEYIATSYEPFSNFDIIGIFIVAEIVIVRMKEKSISEKLILSTFVASPFAAYLLGSITNDYMLTEPAYLLSILLIYIRIFSERGKKLAEQQLILNKQSTALMISQIQPHFLYNVLTTISNLCVTDPEEAEETTVLFSQYLRTNLDSLRNENPVVFSMELGHIRTYVELEKKRFGDKLNVEYDIQESNFCVPSLGLQPIVENSIKHGIRGKNEPGHIKIGSYKVEDGYRILIEDDGVGFDMNVPHKEDGRSHVGMINVKERLRRMCNATVTIESSPGNGCKTEIIIPDLN